MSIGTAFGKKMAFARAAVILCAFVNRDLILKEVSELNGIVRIIVRSVCKQF